MFQQLMEKLLLNADLNDEVEIEMAMQGLQNLSLHHKTLKFILRFLVIRF